LRQRGWFTSVNTEPASLHLMLSPKHADVADQYLSDLAACMTGAAAPAAEARYS
jgi:sphinganine-1-phosphate aldolase